MMQFWLRRALAVLLLTIAIPPAWAETGAAALENALACIQPFKPQDVLHALQRDGYIGSSPLTVLDGSPVFAVVKPLHLRDMAIVLVSGWDYQGDLFMRAPGTPPPMFIAATIAGEPAVVASRFDRPSLGHPPSLSIDPAPPEHRISSAGLLTDVMCTLDY